MIHMANALLQPARHRSLPEQLRTFGAWLFGAAAAGLGFEAPPDHRQPPAIGAQPYRGGESRYHRRHHRH